MIDNQEKQEVCSLFVGNLFNMEMLRGGLPSTTKAGLTDQEFKERRAKILSLMSKVMGHQRALKYLAQKHDLSDSWGQYMHILEWTYDRVSELTYEGDKNA